MERTGLHFFMLKLHFYLIVALTGQIVLGQGYDSIAYDIKRLGPHINTDYDEISPVVSLDHKTLYFTRVGSPDFDKTLYFDHRDLSTSLDSVRYMDKLQKIYSQIAQRTVLEPVSSYFNQDVYMAKGKPKVFEQIQHPSYPLNSALPNSICSKTTDPNRFVIVNKFHTDGGMEPGFSYIRRNKEGGFDFPEDINIEDFYTNSEVVGLCMVPDGNAIILTLDRDDGYGSLDLYVSFKIDEKHWSRPLNLGPQINSPYREIAPYVSKDNNRLYFASNRSGRGDFDIYYASRQAYAWQQWTDPIALPYPINSSANESQAFLLESSNDLYFITDRDGSDDIYCANLTPIILKEKIVDLHVRVINTETDKMTKGLILYGPASIENYPHFFNSYTGEFFVRIRFKKDYRFGVEKPGFIGSEVILDPDMFAGDSTHRYELTLEVTPARKKRFIKIHDIRFEQAKAKVLPSSLPELNRLARVLKQNPYLRIRIEGHTDNVGDKNALIQLSNERAKSIKRYLIEKGIAAHRIQTLGYGDQKPLNDNRTEEDKRINRRVEVRILRK